VEDKICIQDLEDVHLEDREVHGMILKQILGRQVLRMGGGWKWLRNASNGGLWY